MRKYIILILASLMCNFISAQNITTTEYFFDGNDNGFGSNTVMPANGVIDISSLSNGFHDVYIRVFDAASNGGAGAWSHYDRSTFYISAFPTGQNIVSARYVIDNGSSMTEIVDPMATSVTESFMIQIGSLSEGFHSLYIETQDADGTWSHYDRATFYVSGFPSGQNIVSARYYFDDGLVESGILPVNPQAPSITQSYMISTGALSEGFHNFYIETQLTDGTWSLYDKQTIFVKDFSDMPADIVAAEYFIDTDPGFGLGESFDFTSNPLFVTTDMNIAEGDHSLCIRVQNTNGDWSLYSCATFNVDSLGIVDSLFKSVKINPNPFISTIELDVSRTLVFQKISIFDITGKEVYVTTDNLRQLDLDNLEAGTYILSLQTENEKATFKIIKQ